MVDSGGSAHCFLGYQRDEQPFDLAWYSPSVALHDKDGLGSYRFVELRRGIIERRGFLRRDDYYKVLKDRHLLLPRATSSYFGVVHGGEDEDEDLTRQVFGATRREYLQIARAVAKVVGRTFHDALDLPRLTFSKTRSNRCDVSGCLIPKNFPYVAFDSAQYDWSHVSLFGLSRLLSFLCPSDDRSPTKNALLQAGADPQVMHKLVEGALNASPIFPNDRDW